MVIDRDPLFTVVADVGTLAEARAAIENLGTIDLLVVDLHLPDGLGTAAIAAMHAVHPACMALVLTASIDPLDQARAVEEGAAGVLHKSAPLADIVAALRKLNEGEWLLSQNEIIQLLRVATRERDRTREAQSLLAQLTPRERDVLDALAEGLSSKQIAAKLFITVETERTHMVNVLSKLDVHSRLEALVYALRHGAVQIH